jgi:rhodanese-related sulfurtransferase
MAALRLRARRYAENYGAAFVAPRTAHGWLADTSRTTYLLDVRPGEEFATGTPGFVHAPGGQLVQATDQWIGVKGRASYCATPSRCEPR